MSTSRRAGAASSIWTNTARSFAAGWWLSNKSLAKSAQKGPDAEHDVDWPWKSCMKGWEECGGGMVGSGSKVHGDFAARHNVNIG